MTSAGEHTLTTLLKRQVKPSVSLNGTLKYITRILSPQYINTLIRPQLEYASTVWSPHTAPNIYKLEAVQFRAARLATLDYRLTSSVTAILQNLNWRPFDQRRIDSHLRMLCKVTYDLVSIPVSEYLIPNGGESKFIHPLPYSQLSNNTKYYKNSFFPQEQLYTGTLFRPVSSCYPPWYSSVMLSARWCMYHLNHRFYLLPILLHNKQCHTLLTAVH